MNWEDEGYLLSKRKFRENANIINIFTSKRGKVSGIVYGGNSRKIRNYLQISNKLFVINNSKNDNKIGYFKTELIKPISPNYFNDKERTSALISISSLLNSLLPESQPNVEIYKSLENFLDNLLNDNWIILFIFFELNLIRNLGYDTNLKIYKEKIDTQNKSIKVKIDDIQYDVPNYLVEADLSKEISKELILKSLTFTRKVLLNKFFLPNNLIFPKSRVILENYYT